MRLALRSSAANLEDSARLGYSVDLLQLTKNVAKATNSLVSALNKNKERTCEH
jgi:hypothetical protein